MPTLWPTFLSQAEAGLLLVWLWRIFKTPQIPLEQAKPIDGPAQEVKTSLRKWLSPY
jgi:hypothetical protein